MRWSLEIKVMIIPTEKIKRTKEDKEAKQKTEKKNKMKSENIDRMKFSERVIIRWQTSNDLHRYIPWEY